jgi:hypothetical protein
MTLSSMLEVCVVVLREKPAADQRRPAIRLVLVT